MKGLGALGGFALLTTIVFIFIYVITRSPVYSVIGSVIFVIFIWFLLEKMHIV